MEKAVLSGRVLDINGEAVKGSEVFLYSTPNTRRPADFISPKTNDGGFYRLSVPGGVYWAVARLRQGKKYGPLLMGDKHSGMPLEIDIGPNEIFKQDFTVVDIREAARLVKKTNRDSFKVSGKVVNKKMVPVGDVYVFANEGMELKDIPDYISGWTGEDGYYNLFLPEGEYYIGCSFEFPPDLKNKVLKQLHVKYDVSDYNIVIEQTGKGEPD